MFNTRIFDNNYESSANSITGNNGGNDIQPIDISYQRQPSIFSNGRLRRESIAHSQGMGGVSWGSVTIGSWLKDEVMMFGSAYNLNNNLAPHIHHHIINPRRGSIRNQTSSISISPPVQASYLPDLEADYCKDYVCCGQLLPTLHDLLRHYEEAHISSSPPPDQHMINSTRNRNARNNVHNVMETVSTTDVFLNNHHTNTHNSPSINMNTHFNMQQNALNQSGLDSTIPQNSPIPNNQGHNQAHTMNIHQQPLPLSQALSEQQQVQSHQVHHSPSFPSIPSRAESGTPHMDDDSSMYIDDPARHLYVMENNELKPYRCPVIGCEKTYKNQNGLKYHRLHGHQNQTLKENPDGTISIIDPESNTPYLDGTGMEKDKPYRCEVCGKRYKNLNGLKYHRGHTTH